MAEKIYQAYEIIFTKGDPSDFAYVIKSGEVEVLRNYPEAPSRLALLSSGDIFGEMGLVDERPRSLTARSVSETQVTTITRDEFADLILHHPEEAFRYLRMFFERLRAMNMRAAQKDGGLDPKPKKPRDHVVTLIPQTPQAKKVLPSSGQLVSKFPFRVGRSSSRHGDPFDVNDLSLPDTQPFHVSRNHFSIERRDGQVFIHDRGSFLGTIVNGNAIGGHHHDGWTELTEGEHEIIVGSQHSPFSFSVHVSANQ